MNVERYISIQAIQTKSNELIPIWSDRVSFEKTEMYGNVIHIDSGHNEYFNTVECVFDLKTKEVKTGIEVDIYPDKLDYQVNEQVYVESNERTRSLTETFVRDILYESYELKIYKGKSILNENGWLQKRLEAKGIKVEFDSLYAIKMWEPTYVFGNGSKTKWTHKIFKKAI